MIKKFNYINLDREYYELKGKEVVIWGRSLSALELFRELTLKKCMVIGFTDSFVESDHQNNTTFAGIPVIAFDEIRNMSNVIICISTRNYEFLRDILEQTDSLENAIVLAHGDILSFGKYDTELMHKKISNDKVEIEIVKNNLLDERSIETFNKLLEYRTSNKEELIVEIYEKNHPQYFPSGEIISPEEGEVFVDAGGYQGDTSFQFSQWNPRYSKIYLMEPDCTMFAIAQEYVRLKGVRDISCINRAAFSHTTEIPFINDISTGSSRIEADGFEKVKTIAIDEMLNGNKATYIKMDIEGTEMDALRGCIETIKNFHPKLAISIYHKDDDLWKIPYYILQTYPFYKLYMRHYTFGINETVLYATV